MLQCSYASTYCLTSFCLHNTGWEQALALLERQYGIPNTRLMAITHHTISYMCSMPVRLKCTCAGNSR